MVFAESFLSFCGFFPKGLPQIFDPIVDIRSVDRTVEDFAFLTHCVKNLFFLFLDLEKLRESVP